MLSSKSEGKQEARFAARIDVLTERVDMLASTIATTASAIAKKDGEIAALQRAFESRDETIRALVQHVNRAAAAPAADVPVDATELRSLRNAVAALTKERASGVTAAHLEAVDGTVRALSERVDALAAAVAAPPAPDPATTARVDALAADVASVQAALERPPEELVAGLEALGERVDGIAAWSSRIDRLAETLEALERKSTFGEEQVDRRFEATDDALANITHRLDSLALQSRRLATLAAAVEDIERTRDSAAEQLDRRFEATDDSLAKLSQRVDALGERLETTRAVGEEQIDRRFRETHDALTSLGGRLDALPEVDEERLERRLGRTDDTVTALARRLDTVAGSLGRLEHARSAEDEQLDRRFTATNEALTTLSRRLDTLQGVDEAELAVRFETMDGALAKLSQRLDTLAATVENASAGLSDKERELVALQHHFAASSTRIESVVDDIREALHAFPVPSSTSLDELAARLERMESTTRKATEASARIGGELSSRIDLIDQRVASVAEEVSRAKALWPVALRSLEARLDDAVHGRRPEPNDGPAPNAHSTDTQADELLAGVRDSLHAMETVAREIADAAERLSEPSEDPAVDAHTSAPEQPGHVPAPTAGGATIVPLRTGEP